MRSDPLFFALFAKVDLYLKAWQVFKICSTQCANVLKKYT